MKNILFYYYQLTSLSLHYQKGIYYFEKDNHLYLFKEVKRSFDEINQIQKLITHYAPKYHQIIPNKDGSFLTFVDQKPYLLLKVRTKSTKEIPQEILKNQEIIYEDAKNFSHLYRLNWVELWSMKIDYFEYQIKHLENKYPLLANSIAYFIGLAENAISYTETANLYLKKSPQDSPTISHIRCYCKMKEIDYYDPFTIILDHKARDVGEYLKSLFYEDLEKEEKLILFLKQLNFSSYGYALLISRLLYPSYYFDLYEEIILGQKKEEEIKKIIKKADSYRQYLRTIYKQIQTLTDIPTIDWLESF